MPETLVQQPTATQPVNKLPEQKVSTSQTPDKQTVDDLVRRASTEPKLQELPPDLSLKPEDIGYNSTDIEKIKDPMARQVIQNIYKNMEKGLNRKFMELAEERRKVEDQRKQFESDRQSLTSWTPDRLEATLRDPNFVQLAQARIQAQQAQQAPNSWDGSQEQWSALTLAEQQHIRGLEQKVNGQQMLMNQMLTSQADERIKARFPDYDPHVVDSFQQELLSNRVSDAEIRELIWKAINFPRYVEQSYRFGNEDRNGNLKEKLNASTFSQSGVSATSADEVPPRREGEPSTSWFKRIAEFRLQKAKQEGKFVSKN